MSEDESQNEDISPLLKTVEMLGTLEQQQSAESRYEGKYIPFLNSKMTGSDFIDIKDGSNIAETVYQNLYSVADIHAANNSTTE